MSMPMSWMGYYIGPCVFCGEGIGHYQPWGVVPGCGYAHVNCNTSWDEFGYRLVAVPVSYDALQDQGC